MEMHIIDIVRFATCILSFIIAIVAMINAMIIMQCVAYQHCLRES